MKQQSEEPNVVNQDDTHKIGSFFGGHRHDNSRNVIAYTRHGRFINVQLIQEGVRHDSSTFDISTESGNDSFCKYVFEKLGIDFKGYKKRKNIEWQ